MEPETFRREMFADDRHLQVRGVASAELGGQREPRPPGGVGTTTHLAQQHFPLRSWHATVLEVGAGPFATVVEEPFVVVSRLQWRDLPLDEVIERVEGRANV